MIFDRIVPWARVHRIITLLAREGFLEENLVRMKVERGDFTSRLSIKHGGDIPVPIDYTRTVQPERTARLGGIDRWLQAWNVGMKVLARTSSTAMMAMIARESWLERTARRDWSYVRGGTLRKDGSFLGLVAEPPAPEMLTGQSHQPPVRAVPTVVSALPLPSGRREVRIVVGGLVRGQCPLTNANKRPRSLESR
jgi:hypothetical protein